MTYSHRRPGALGPVAASSNRSRTLAPSPRRWFRRQLATSALMAAGLAGGTSVAAEPSGEEAAGEPSVPEAIGQERQSTSQIQAAERLAAKAFEHYGRRQYREAINLYEQALQAAPAANIYYNLARIFDLGLRDRQNAAKYYRKYAEHPSAARQRADYARLRVEELSDAPPIGAVAEPNEPQSPQPERDVLEQFRASPGLQLQSTSRGALEPIDSPAWTSTEIAAASVAGVGAASLLVATGYAVGAYSQRQTWQRECEGNECSSQRGVDAATSALNRADRATIALAAGGTLVALGSAIYWLSADQSQESEMPLFRVAVSPTGAAISGSF